MTNESLVFPLFYLLDGVSVDIHLHSFVLQKSNKFYRRVFFLFLFLGHTLPSDNLFIRLVKFTLSLSVSNFYYNPVIFYKIVQFYQRDTGGGGMTFLDIPSPSTTLREGQRKGAPKDNLDTRDITCYGKSLISPVCGASK